MVFLIRGLLWLVLLVGVVTCSATVKIGERTLVQHVRRIWQTEEAQELVREVKEEAGPAVRKVERGIKAGVREVRRDAGADPDAAPHPRR